MKWEAWSIVFTGLSLTCVTAVVLFLLVAVNPKDAVYGSTPLYYAGGSAVVAAAFNRASAWAARRAGPPGKSGTGADFPRPPISPRDE
jgi:hypothetical protein